MKKIIKGDITTVKPPYGWKEFHTVMNYMAEINEIKDSQLLDLIKKYDHFVCKLVNRSTSYKSNRPQDYVVCILGARSFRLATGGIYLAVSGYSDLSPNLGRTIWEISLRLINMKSNPVASSLGYLLFSCAEDLSIDEAELKYRTENNLELVYIPDHIKAKKEYFNKLKSEASKKGLNPDKIQKKYGKISIYKICKELGIEKAYKVNYGYDCGHVHERNLTTHTIVKETKGGREFELGPINEACLEGAADILTNLSLALYAAAEIVEDKKLVIESEDLMKEIKKRYDLCKNFK